MKAGVVFMYCSYFWPISATWSGSSRNLVANYSFFKTRKLENTNQDVARKEERDENSSSSKISNRKEHDEEAGHDRVAHEAVVEDCYEAVGREF